MKVDPEYSETFLQGMLNVDRQAAAECIERALENGVTPDDVVLKIINVAMDRLGELQADQVVVLAQVFAAAQIVDNALKRLLPLLKKKRRTFGTVVLGNIQGDNHSLGRKTVATFLRVAGYEVHDMGASVPPAALVDKARETGAHVIGVSALLLHTAKKISEVRPLLNEAGLSHVKLIVGGAPFNMDPTLYRRVGADATTQNAHDAVRAIRMLLAKPVRFLNPRTNTYRWRDAITGRFIPAPADAEEMTS